MADRKRSPLGGDEDDVAPWQQPATPATGPAPTVGPVRERHDTPSNQGKPASEEPAGPVEVTPIQGRRKRSSRGLDEFDMVSFNCRLPVVTRRAARAFAVEHDVDVQDVVNDALVRYLAEFGVVVPRSQQE